MENVLNVKTREELRGIGDTIVFGTFIRPLFRLP